MEKMGVRMERSVLGEDAERAEWVCLGDDRVWD